MGTTNGTSAPHAPGPKPVIIVGAGVSGLLLAQSLRKHGVPFQIYERDQALTYRGVGWGLTLHWSLPALHALLPAELAARLPEAYVDRAAVARGEVSAFPFFDLSTGELKAKTPPAPEAQRIRVSRDRFRRLIATGVDIRWGKTLRDVVTDADSVIVNFEDGSSAVGCLLVACDGAHSRVRRVLLPEQHHAVPIPVGILGAKVSFTPAQVAPLRNLDAFFLQGAASENDTFVFFSMLDAPGNDGENSKLYSCQIMVSWPFRDGFFGAKKPILYPETNAERLELMKRYAKTWAEPFRSLVLGIPDGTEAKSLTLTDWPPPKNMRSSGRAVLMGDAFHAMAMYRGEGANHAILDVLEFTEIVTPHLKSDNFQVLRRALDDYEVGVVSRTRSAVLASRRACLDAHDWTRINDRSPLLTKRAMKIEFSEEVI